MQEIQEDLNTVALQSIDKTEAHSSMGLQYELQLDFHLLTLKFHVGSINVYKLKQLNIDVHHDVVKCMLLDIRLSIIIMFYFFCDNNKK